MPSLETSDLREKAVLWEATGRIDNSVKPILKPPVEIRVRWLSGMKLGGDGQTEDISTAATLIVDRDIAFSSILWYGQLKNLPSPPTDLMQLDSKNEIPDLKGRNKRRTITVMRYGDTLPTVEA